MNILRVRAKQQLCSSFLQTAGLQVPMDAGVQPPPHPTVVRQSLLNTPGLSRGRNLAKIASVYTSVHGTGMWRGARQMYRGQVPTEAAFNQIQTHFSM